MTSPEPRWEELDPFRSVADPDTYVARAATERALQELTSALQQDAGGALVLLGPAGIGKSVVLKLLVNRLADAYTFACVPTAGASAEELAEMALDVLKDVRGDDPVGALAAASERLAAAGRPLVLAIDLADAPADDGLTQLAPRLAAEAPRLHLLLVATERVGLEPLLEGLGPRLQRVRLVAPMSQDETAAYIESRLERGSTELDLRGCLDAEKVAKLHAVSGGNPAALHAALSRMQLELWSADRPAPAPEQLDVPDDSDPLTDDSDVVLQDAGFLFGGEAPVPAGALELVDLAAVPAPEPVIAEPALPAAPAAERGAPARIPTRVWPPAPLAAAFLLGIGVGAGLMAWLGADSAVSPRIVESAASESSEPPPVAAGSRSPAASPEASAERVRVNIQAFPWARVYVDGQSVGETPLADLEIAPGRHEIRAVLPDGRVLIREVVLESGSRVVFR